MKKEYKIQIIIMIIVIILGTIGFTYIQNENNKKNLACYNFHVAECESCHAQNKTLALCSGFCFEPRDIEDTTDEPNGANTINFCSIHPKENCKEHVPKHCLI